MSGKFFNSSFPITHYLAQEPRYSSKYKIKGVKISRCLDTQIRRLLGDWWFNQDESAMFCLDLVVENNFKKKEVLL